MGSDSCALYAASLFYQNPFASSRRTTCYGKQPLHSSDVFCSYKRIFFPFLGFAGRFCIRKHISRRRVCVAEWGGGKYEAAWHSLRAGLGEMANENIKDKKP